jgi:hypothetical protein
LKEKKAMKNKIVFLLIVLSLVLAACGVKAAATPSVQLVVEHHPMKMLHFPPRLQRLIRMPVKAPGF